MERRWSSPGHLHELTVADKTESEELTEIARAAFKETAGVAVSKPKAPACPHCGSKLRAENDLGDHLHCDSKDCLGRCCFDPGDPPTLRDRFPHCPSLG